MDTSPTARVPSVALPLPEASDFLAGIERRIADALDDGAPAARSDILRDAAARLCLTREAKRLRPQLVLCFGRQVAIDDEPLQCIATAAELIHSASLLHDDVVDRAMERRGMPTANARWGNSAAVLAGDWLLTRALSLMGNLPARVTMEAVATIAEMTRAAMDEVEAVGRIDTPMDRWRAIAEGKTGSLFSWCGRAVAGIAQRDDAHLAFDRFGRHLGVAFQIADDLRDLLDPQLGKDRHSDLRNRQPSFALILAAETDRVLRARIASLWRSSVEPCSESEIAQCAAAAASTGVLPRAIAQLESEVTAAIAALEPYRGDSWADTLAGMATAFVGGVRAFGVAIDRRVQ